MSKLKESRKKPSLAETVLNASKHGKDEASEEVSRQMSEPAARKENTLSSRPSSSHSDRKPPIPCNQSSAHPPVKAVSTTALDSGKGKDKIPFDMNSTTRSSSELINGS